MGDHSLEGYYYYHLHKKFLILLSSLLLNTLEIYFRFSTVFNHDNDSLPRVWTGKEDIRTITKDARAAVILDGFLINGRSTTCSMIISDFSFTITLVQSLRLLSVMAAIRLDEKPDKVESLLFSSLMDGTAAASLPRDRSIGDSVDPLASSMWEEVVFS